jgi:hypothetical protein
MDMKGLQRTNISLRNTHLQKTQSTESTESIKTESKAGITGPTAQELTSAPARSQGIRRNLAGTSVNRATSLRTTRTTSAMSAAPQGNVADTAREILFTNSPEKAVGMLTEALQTSSVSQRTTLLKEMASQFPERLGTLLTWAQSPANQDRGGVATIAESLGMAYSIGELGQDDLKSMMPADDRSVDPGALSQLFNNSNSRGLMVAAAKTMTEIGENAGTRKSEFYGGAANLAATSPEVAGQLTEHLAQKGQLTDFVKNAPAEHNPRVLKGDFGSTGRPLLNGMMKHVFSQSPPSEAAFQLFEASTGSPKGPEMQGLMGQFFQDNREEILNRLCPPNQTPTAENGKKFIHFVENFAFGPEFSGQEAVRTELGHAFSERVEEIGRFAKGDHRGDDKARQLGFLLGGIESGFKKALSNTQNKNAENRKMTDLLVNALGGPLKKAIPFDLKVGKLSLKNMPFEYAKNTLGDWLKTEEPDFDELVQPLREMAETIPGDFSDEMYSITNRLNDL